MNTTMHRLVTQGVLGAALLGALTMMPVPAAAQYDGDTSLMPTPPDGFFWSCPGSGNCILVAFPAAEPDVWLPDTDPATLLPDDASSLGLSPNG